MKPKYPLHIFRASLATVIVLGTGQSARAVTTLYWDTNGSTSGLAAGNGTWGSSTYWNTSSAGTSSTVGWTSGDIAEFDTTGSPNTNTITMGANITAAGLNFQTGTTTIGSVGDGYKISLGTSYLTGSGSGTGIINTNLAFTTNESSTINTGGSIYVYGVISGAYSFSTHADTGGVTYFYNTANTYSGGTTITGAPLHIAVLGNSSANSSIGTGALTFNYGHAGTGNCDLVFDGANATGSTTNRLFTITSTSATQNTNAEIINNGSGAVNFNNTGSLTMTGAYIHGLQLGGGYTGANNTFAPIISNPSGSTTSFTKSDAGTWVLTGANTYTGGTTVNGGTLALSGSGTLGGSSGTVMVTNGAILDLGGTTQTVGTVGASGAGNGVVGTIQDGTLNIQQNNMCFQNGTLNVTLSGTAGGGSQRLWIGGDASATVLLGGNNTIQYSDHNSTIIGNAYTGAAGTVKLTSATALGPNTETTQVFAGTLDLNGQTNVTCAQILLASGASSSLVNNNTSTASSYGGTVQSTTGAQYGGAGNLTLSGSASSTDLTKIGAGTLTLSGANTYTGATTISGGTLQIGNAGTTGSLSSSTSITNNATLAFDRTDNYGGAVSNTISGSGAVTVMGGSLTLSGNNSYGGATNVNGGTLAINGNQSAATGTVTVASGATLTGTGTIGGATTIQNGGIHAPTAQASGSGQTFTGNLTYSSGSIFDWNINEGISTGNDQGTYGQVVANGSVAGTAVFNIVLGGGNAFTDPFWRVNETWDNIFSGTGVTGTTMASLFSTFGGAVNSAGVASGGLGYFTINGSTDTLTWTATPEPTSALAGLLIGAGLLRRRRNQF